MAERQVYIDFKGEFTVPESQSNIDKIIDSFTRTIDVVFKGNMEKVEMKVKKVI